MSTSQDGARVGFKISQLPRAIKDRLDKATKKSGDDLVRISKVLIPVKTGASRMAIHDTQNSDGSVLVDFGQKAKVIEENFPFVNPALRVTRKKHSARARRAAAAAVKAVMNG